MRASSPVSQTKQNSVIQTLAALVTEEAKYKVCQDKSVFVIVVLVQNFYFNLILIATLTIINHRLF